MGTSKSSFLLLTNFVILYNNKKSVNSLTVNKIPTNKRDFIWKRDRNNAINNKKLNKKTEIATYIAKTS